MMQRRCAAAAPTAAAAGRRRSSSSSSPVVRASGGERGGGGGGNDEEERRAAIKRLQRLFYYDGGGGGGGGTSNVVVGGGSSAAASAAAGRQRAGSAAPRRPRGARLLQVPLWRVEWAMLPFTQTVLQVSQPFYLDSFERIFASAERPFLFGHLYLPGGSRALDDPAAALGGGASRAPVVGVLMTATRAVRLRDRLLVLATAGARFRVARVRRERPYAVADVELLEDVEAVDAFNGPSLNAAMRAASSKQGASGGGGGDGDATPLVDLMAAASRLARDAAAAHAWEWLSYELAVAQRAAWPRPREGENDAETYALVQELADAGVADDALLPLPDGAVVGRRNLGAVAASADAAVAAALDAAPTAIARAARARQRQQQRPLAPPVAGDSGGDGDSISSAGGSGKKAAAGESPAAGSTSYAAADDAADDDDDEGAAMLLPLTTALDRGALPPGDEFQALFRSSASAGPDDVAQLEREVWEKLDELAALSSRLKGRQHQLPYSLLQLRPPPAPAPAPPSSGAGAEGAQEPQPGPPPPRPPLPRYAFAASAGSEAHADPRWPALRRAAKLSWAAALATGARELSQAPEARQALLEATSVAQRLRFALALLDKAGRVLAALAAVKDAADGSGSGGGGGSNTGRSSSSMEEDAGGGGGGGRAQDDDRGEGGSGEGGSTGGGTGSAGDAPKTQQ